MEKNYSDQEFCEKAIKDNFFAFCNSFDSVKNQPDSIYRTHCIPILNPIVEKLKDNTDFMLCAVTKDSRIFEYARENLKEDKKFILAALTTAKAPLNSLISENLRIDKDFMIEAIITNKEAFNVIPKNHELRNNQEIKEALETTRL